MKAPPERRPAPKGDRDLSLCVVSPPYFCTDTDWCFARLVLLACWCWLLIHIIITSSAALYKIVQNYNAIAQHILDNKSFKQGKTLPLS